MQMPERSPRFHGLDGVRATAMILGVFLHASMPYIHVGFPWAVVDPSRSISLTLLIYAIHSFRMPAFFLIAGFFARLVFHRDGSSTFLRHRIKRILLPLVAGWLVLHPIVRALWVWSGVRAMPDASVADLHLALGIAFSPDFILRGLSLMHLWFLYYLLVLYIAFLAARWLFTLLDPSARLRSRIDAFFRSVVASPLAPIAFALPTTAILLLMRGWGVDFVERSLVPRIAHILLYGTFFTIGWLLHRNPPSVNALRRRWLLHSATAVASLVPLTAMLYVIYSTKTQTGPWFRVAYFGLYALLTWSGVLALLGIFQRFFDQPRWWWRYLADASYWLYLSHFPLVIALSVLLREWSVPWFVKLPAVLSISLPVLLASYHLMVRATWIGVFLNGRRLPARGWRADPIRSDPS